MDEISLMDDQTGINSLRPNGWTRLIKPLSITRQLEINGQKQVNGWPDRHKISGGEWMKKDLFWPKSLGFNEWKGSMDSLFRQKIIGGEWTKKTFSGLIFWGRMNEISRCWLNILGANEWKGPFLAQKLRVSMNEKYPWIAFSGK